MSALPSTYVDGDRWWYVSTRYKTEQAAKAAFDRMNKIADEKEGEARIAGYRLLDGPRPQGGKAVICIVVGHIEKEVEEAAESLGGYPVALPHETVVALIKRRIKFIAAGAALAAPPGVYTTNYGEGGIHLDDEGDPKPPEETK